MSTKAVEADQLVTGHDDVTDQVLAVQQNWQIGPRVTLVAGSGKAAAFTKIVSALTAFRSWPVPVPVGQVESTNPAGLLRSAKANWK